MNFRQRLDEKIREYERFIEDFQEVPEKKLLFCLFTAELKTLRTTYLQDDED